MSDRTRELECVIEDLKQQVRDVEKDRDALRAELDALKAWKEEVEKQEPVAWQGIHDRTDLYYSNPQADVRPLYARTVPASAPEGSVVQSAARIMNFDLIKQRDILMEAITSIRSLSAEHPKDPVACSIAAHQIAERAMLATTPEVK